MHWITPVRRLALYLRDGLACAYCGAGIEDGTRLTLDHIVPYSATEKPDNSNGNLVTACLRCNSSRGTRSLAVFCKALAAYLDHGIEAATVRQRVRACLKRPVDTQSAKEILARRGNFSATLAELKGDKK
jgi:hypothetical protein